MVLATEMSQQLLRWYRMQSSRNYINDDPLDEAQYIQDANRAERCNRRENTNANIFDPENGRRPNLKTKNYSKVLSTGGMLKFGTGSIDSRRANQAEAALNCIGASSTEQPKDTIFSSMERKTLSMIECFTPSKK